MILCFILQQIVHAYLEAFEHVILLCCLLLNNHVLCTGKMHIAEDCVEAYHAALSNLVLVFYMENFEATRVSLEVINGTSMTEHCPIDIHLYEDILRIGVAEQIVKHDFLAFHLAQLVVVVVIAELYALLFADVSYPVKVFRYAL